ncbi:hypothetical protein [Kribbella yunnanensis]|uniref:hypothetical protein n=1 Tax=Kribbella yunnanensis TaxID=190194 RepID=UPI0031E1749F
MRDGELVPASIVLTHDEQLRRLATASPAALSSAFVGGDPCFDRMVASEHQRNRYRHALGVDDDRTIVAVTSTWGRRSLFGAHPDLITELTTELEIDSYVIAVILHPNTWYAHGPAQIRLWLGEALRGGLRLIPPAEGWQQAILASDIVIGDNGSVTGYGAATGRPTLLATFPSEDVVPGSVIDALGQSAARLDLRAAFQPQLAAAHPADPEVRTLTTSAPSEASDRHRAEFYRLMNLPELASPALLPIYSSDDLRPIRSPLTAWWASTSTDAEGNITVRRWPADPVGRPNHPPQDVHRHLVVAAHEPRRDLSGNAAICIIEGSDSHTTAASVLRQRPVCSLVVTRESATTCTLTHRAGWSARLTARPDQGLDLDPAILASVIHDQSSFRRGGPILPLAFVVYLGSRRVTVSITEVRSGVQ